MFNPASTTEERPGGMYPWASRTTDIMLPSQCIMLLVIAVMSRLLLLLVAAVRAARLYTSVSRCLELVYLQNLD